MIKKQVIWLAIVLLLIVPQISAFNLRGLTNSASADTGVNAPIDQESNILGNMNKVNQNAQNNIAASSIANSVGAALSQAFAGGPASANTAVNAPISQSSNIAGNANAVTQNAQNNIDAESEANAAGSSLPICAVSSEGDAEATTAVNAPISQSSDILGSNNSVAQNAQNNIAASSTANSATTPSPPLCVSPGSTNAAAKTAVNAPISQSSNIAGNGNAVTQNAQNNIAASSTANGGGSSSSSPGGSGNAAATTAVNAPISQSSGIVGNGNTVTQNAQNNIAASSNATNMGSSIAAQVSGALGNAFANTAVNAPINQTSNILGSNNAVAQNGQNNIAASSDANGGGR